jgi:hypothetical protein
MINEQNDLQQTLDLVFKSVAPAISRRGTEQWAFSIGAGQLPWTQYETTLWGDKSKCAIGNQAPEPGIPYRCVVERLDFPKAGKSGENEYDYYHWLESIERVPQQPQTTIKAQTPGAPSTAPRFGRDETGIALNAIVAATAATISSMVNTGAITGSLEIQLKAIRMAIQQTYGAFVEARLGAPPGSEATVQQQPPSVAQEAPSEGEPY